MVAVTIMFIGFLVEAGVALFACYGEERMAKRCDRLEKMNCRQRKAIDELQYRCWELEDLLNEKGA